MKFVLQLLRIWLLQQRLFEFNRVKSNEEKKTRVDADSIFDRRLDDENHLGNRKVRTVK